MVEALRKIAKYCQDQHLPFIRPRLENFTWWKLAVVLLSMTVFAFCLTQTAFVTPSGVRYNGVDELVNNSSLDSLKGGWIAVPIFLLYWLVPTALAFFISYVMLTWRERFTRRNLIICAAALAAIMVLADFAVHSIFGTRRLLSVGEGAWLANPAIIVSWSLYLFGARRSAFISSVVTLVLMLSFLAIDQLPFGLKDGLVRVVKYDMGYWAWVLSAAVMVVASLPFRPNQSAPPVSRDT